MKKRILACMLASILVFVSMPPMETKAVTEADAAATTEAVTETSTEAVTETSTEAVTEANTEATTEANSDTAVEATTEATDDIAAEAITEVEAEDGSEDVSYSMGTLDDFSHPVMTLAEAGLATTRASSVLASTYKSSYVTSVKSQGSYETCWAFSAMAAIEASLWKEGLATSSIDLSEWQLAYYTYHTSSDPLGLTSSDTITTSSSYLTVGGNQYMATASLANWKGAVTESNAAYSVVTANASATLSSSLAYNKDTYHLENAYWISMSDRTQVKQAIIDYGAVVGNYYHSSSYLDTSTYSYYCSSDITYNHAITIVGWDDTYSKTNFTSGSQPSSDGAWLCKNSWGTSWGNSGYFWISYEDATLDSNVYVYDFTTADNYTYNYQYDGTPAMYHITGSSSTIYAANVYTAQSVQILKAVGYYTYDTGYATTVYVYKNPTSSSNPTSGTLVASQSVQDTYAGFHTLELSSDLVLNTGDVFAVVVKQTAPSGKAAVYVDYSYNGTNYKMVSTAEAGESFISTNGSSWSDIGSADSANNRIKAYTDTTSKSYAYLMGEAFATRLYETCLGREPDASGLAHWATVLSTKQRTGVSVAYGFVFSEEYKQKNTSDESYVTMLYYTFLDRAPDQSGYEHWLDLLNQGLSREYVFRGFALSTEFTNLCASYGFERGSFTVTQARDKNVNLTKYVNRLYVQALGRQGEEDGLNHWCNVIQKKAKTPEEVAESFILSAEFQNKNLSDSEYIKVLYRTFLGREYDQSGYEHWMGELQRGCTRENIMHRFATSEEFKQIQASFGL